jgi:hypothetical protein
MLARAHHESSEEEEHSDIESFDKAKDHLLLMGKEMAMGGFRPRRNAGEEWLSDVERTCREGAFL